MNCKLCSKEISFEFMELVKTELKKQQLCFHCHFWQGYVLQKDDKRIVRVKGEHYCIAPELSDPNYGGHGGHKFYIKFFDGRLAVTTNLWNQGTIPANFRNELPDNAVFVKEKKTHNYTNENR
jgi:hypothetical protein